MKQNDDHKDAYLKKIVILVSVLIVCASYLALHIRYDNNQHHYFDPYLQAFPDKFDVEEQKDEEIFRILTLGGSTTKHPGIALDENYPAKLEKLLQEQYPHRTIEVLNGGKDWYSSRHSLINYTGYGSWFNADVVLVMHAVNDLYRSFSPEKYARFDYDPTYSHFYGASINGAEPPSFDKVLLDKIRRKMGWDPKTHYRPTSLETEAFKSLESFKKNMDQLGRYIQSDSAVCIYVQQGSLYNDTMIAPELYKIGFHHEFCNFRKDGQIYYPNYQSMHKAMNAYNKTVREVADKNGASCLNADSILPKTLKYFTDDVHYTTPGAELLAQYIAERIIEMKIIE